jgi:hypothetical protein
LHIFQIALIEQEKLFKDNFNQKNGRIYVKKPDLAARLEIMVIWKL